MKESEKLVSRLIVFLMCLPILLTAGFSFSAMAENGVIDMESYDGQVILEDPDLIGDIEEDSGEIVDTPADIPATDASNDTSTDAPVIESSVADIPATDPPAASYEIAMDAPSGWYANRAAMEINVTDAGGTGWTNIQVIMGSTTLIDGALPSGHLWLDVLDNCVVQVIVTDPYGATHDKSVTVACFDKERPTLKATVKGEYLHIEASDAQSGVAAVQVNGTTYTEFADGTLDVLLREYADAYEQLLVQAVDKVGNVSKAIAVANPFFHNEPTTAPTNTPKPTKKPSGNSGSSSGSGSNSGSQATATPTAIPTATAIPVATLAPTVVQTYAPTTIESGYPFTDSGNAYTRDLLYDKFTNKQFIAIETRNGDVFYMVIDYDKPLDEDGEQYETYFLNLVDSRDLLDIVGESEITEPEIVYVTPEPTTVPTQAPVTTETETKSDGSATLGIIGLLAIAGGAALWYFKLRKPKNGSKASYDKDYEFEDEDDEEETESEEK